jgi:sodium transport system permease protein
MSAAWVIAKKELRETLRDRRTWVPMVLLPVVLYPAVFALLLEVAATQRAETESGASRVAVVGAHAAEVLAELEKEPLVKAELTSAELASGGLAREDIDAFVVADSKLPPDDTELGSLALKLHWDPAAERSDVARARVTRAVEAWAARELEKRLLQAGMPLHFAEPVVLEAVRETTPERMSGFLLAQILPVLLTAMVSMGAFWPAVDLFAGEKERKTLLSLLTAPVRPRDVVIGKYIAICTLALLVAGCNAGSMGIFFAHAKSMLPGEATGELTAGLGLGRWLGVFAVAAMLGALFSAVMMAVAALARSVKEAQAYVAPVYLLSVLPALFAGLPGSTLSATTSVMPGLGGTLLLKAILIGTPDPALAAAVLVSSAAFTALGIWATLGLFRREELLLGEAGLVSALGLWRARGAAGKPTLQAASAEQSRPLTERSAMGAAEAMALFGLCFALLLYGSGFVRTGVLWGDAAASLGAFVLLPSLVAVRLAGLPLRRAAALRTPHSAWFWVAAAALGLGLWPWIAMLVSALISKLLPIDPQQLAELAPLLAPPDGPLGWALWLVCLALTPAVVEELLFRGLLQRALASQLRPVFAVVVTALLFAAMHMSTWRMPGTFLLGLVAGALAWRSGSLLPAVLFHFANNAGAALWGLAEPSGASLQAEFSVVFLVGAAVLTALGCAILVWAPTPARSGGQRGAQ